jgi:uncharacterized membrane protein YfcA
VQFWKELIILFAAFGAGMVNSIAGGGTLISFPALVWIGRDPRIANATSTFALLPGSFAGMMGFRRELGAVRQWILTLAVPSLLGGVLGAFLLLRTSAHAFAIMVPYLILLATALFAAQEVVKRKVIPTVRPEGSVSRTWRIVAILFQFLVGVYGGYFGAGIGILMLAALGLLGFADMHEMNGLKNLLALLINGIAAVYFAVSGAVVWMDVLVMAAGAMIGGYFGAGLAHKLGPRFVRYSVVGIGLAMTVAMLLTRR